MTTAPALPTTTKQRAALTERIFALRGTMKRLFGASLYRDLREELNSVTIHQLTALGHLKGGSVTMRELARDLDVSESSATAVTDRLVRQGLVERQNDPSDRRVVRLALSPAGRALVERIDNCAASRTGDMLAVLTDAQLEQLLDILEALARSEADGRPLRHGAGR
jgi:DNA-binding MarR family transcriptional regulator